MKNQLKLGIEITLLDKNGNIKYHLAKEADTLLKQFGTLLAGRLFKYYSVCKDVTGADASPTWNGFYSSDFGVNAAAGDDTTGLVAGSGDTIVTYTDFKLETQIPHSASGLYYPVMQITKDSPAEGHESITRLFENRGVGDITIKEIGLIYYCVTQWSGSPHMLIARDVITPVTLAPTDVMNTKYIISWLP